MAYNDEQYTYRKGSRERQVEEGYQKMKEKYNNAPSMSEKEAIKADWYNSGKNNPDNYQAYSNWD